MAALQGKAKHPTLLLAMGKRKASDGRQRIHLLAVGGSWKRLVSALGYASAAGLVEAIQERVGGAYRVTGETRLIDAVEDENKGGRRDDALRARDLQAALGDDRVKAIVSLRGGSWLTRILPRIDFDVLGRRETPVAMFGFSELTTVINIAAAYPTTRCYYDLGPAFLRDGMADYARTNIVDPQSRGDSTGQRSRAFALGWAAAQFGEKFLEFFDDVVAMLDGRGSSRSITGRVVAGEVRDKQPITVVGGTLTVMLPLIGTAYERAIDTQGKWLAVEDVNEAPYRLDRALAHLSLAGLLQRCEGFLIGDIHDERGDLRAAFLELLRRHLGPRSKKPIIVSNDFGHVWPQAPLPIGVPMTLRVPKGKKGVPSIRLEVPWKKLAVV